jgi:hypothetical protein
MLLFVALVLSTCLLAGCGGEARLMSPTVEVASRQATPATVASPSPATPPPGPSIQPIVWAVSVDPTTQEPSEKTPTFGADALSLYGCVSVNNLGEGSVVEATWTYNGTSLDAFATQVILPDDVSTRWIAFHISRDPNIPWPPGTYAISIALNGTVLQSASVEVTEAD